MYNAFRDKVRQGVQFAKEHKTLTACAVTAVTTAYLVHDREISRLTELSAEWLVKEDERHALLLDTTSFIDARGLTEEFFEFAPRMRRS